MDRSLNMFVGIAITMAFGFAVVASSALGAQPGTPPKNVIVWKEKGRFGGWPANCGIWRWGEEILVGYVAADFKYTKDNHNVTDNRIDTDRRSLDGGETWGPPEVSGVGAFLEAPAPGGPAFDAIDFTRPDFAFRIRFYWTGEKGHTKFWFSNDRGHHWQGPYAFPTFGLSFHAGRTDYIVNGPKDMLVLMSGTERPDAKEKVFCVRTSDGGLTWNFVSWVTRDDDPGKPQFTMMPSTVRLPDGGLVTAVRTFGHSATGSPIGWIGIYRSDDEGQSWRFVTKATGNLGGVSNPPAMVLLRDGRLALSYGYRMEPYSIRARLSSNGGRTWDPERILRDDGVCADLGYCRATQRPDGKIVTIYYFNGSETGREQDMTEIFVAATIWDPDYDPPVLSNGTPDGRVWNNAAETKLTVDTDRAAVCKYATQPGVAWQDMPYTFERTGGNTHAATVRGLAPGGHYSFFVKARGVDGDVSSEDFEVSFRVTDLAPAPLHLDLEAEDGALRPPMTVGQDTDASHGKYIFTPAENQGRATYTFSVAGAEDEYVIWVRVMGPDYSHDSFNVSVDDGPEQEYSVNRLGDGKWHWFPLTAPGAFKPMRRSPPQLTLAGGPHTLVWCGREPGARLDRLIITNDRNFVPADE